MTPITIITSAGILALFLYMKNNHTNFSFATLIIFILTAHLFFFSAHMKAEIVEFINTTLAYISDNPMLKIFSFALFEEILKILPFIIILGVISYIKGMTFSKKDIFVMATSAGLGFALPENILYASSFAEGMGGYTKEVYIIFFLRTVITTCAHIVFTNILAVGLFQKNRMAIPLYLFISVFFHSIYNAALNSSGPFLGVIILTVGILELISIYSFFIKSNDNAFLGKRTFLDCMRYQPNSEKLQPMAGEKRSK